MDSELLLVEPLFKSAIALHRQGRLGEADALYRQVLVTAPRHAQATHHLGILALQGGQTARALELLAASLALLDTDANIHANYARALGNAGRIDEALASLDRALALNPCFVGAWVDRANLLLDSTRPEEALTSLQQALEVNPEDPHALNGVGNALLDLGRPEEALKRFSQAIDRAPRVPDFYLNRALTHGRLRQPAAARADCCRARELGHRSAQLYFVEGNALLDLGRAMEALEAFDRALELDPSLARAWNNRGAALRALNQEQAALASFERCIELGRGPPPPSQSQLESQFNRAALLRDLGRHAEAWASLEELAAVAPDRPFVRGYLLQERLTHGCWRDYPDSVANVLKSVERGQPADIPLSFFAISESAAAQLRCARTYVAEIQGSSAAPHITLAPRARERLRVVYLSSDLRSHPVGRLVVAAMECHDRSRFETFALSFGADDGSDVRHRLERAFEHFLDLSQVQDADVAARLSELAPDIAVDLNGHTSGGRVHLLAARPAPIQISWLGFPGTLGVEFIDYIVADRHVIPEATRQHYSEQVIYLPDTYLPADRAPPVALPSSRGDVGLPTQGAVFCCFNACSKLLPPMFDAWMRILKAVPESVLWLRQDAEIAKQHLQREAEQRGVAPARLIFAPSVSERAQHHSRLRLADLFLDTYPYNAHSTAIDALAAALPVITLRGETFASRTASSLLHAVGLGRLAVDSLPAYERLAVELACTPGAFAELRAHLQAARTSAPLFDPARYCRHLEAAYSEIWSRHQRGEHPATVWVQPDLRA